MVDHGDEDCVEHRGSLCSGPCAHHIEINHFTKADVADELTDKIVPPNCSATLIELGNGCCGLIGLHSYTSGFFGGFC